MYNIEMASDSGLSTGSRVISWCVVKFPCNGRHHPLPPSSSDVVKFGVVRGVQLQLQTVVQVTWPSYLHGACHSTLGTTLKLNFSVTVIPVTVTPACAADIEAEVLVACGTPECGLPLLVGHISLPCVRVLLQVLVVGGTVAHGAQ